MTFPPDTAPLPAAELHVVTQAPCLVIHPNVLVAEDLRDILMAEGATDVLTATELSQAPLSRVHLVFVSGAPDTIMASPEATLWAKHATPVVLLDGTRHQASAERAGFHILEEPFRTEDVTALLRRLRVF